MHVFGYLSRWWRYLERELWNLGKWGLAGGSGALGMGLGVSSLPSFPPNLCLSLLGEVRAASCPAVTSLPTGARLDRSLRAQIKPQSLEKQRTKVWSPGSFLRSGAANAGGRSGGC